MRESLPARTHTRASEGEPGAYRRGTPAITTRTANGWSSLAYALQAVALAAVLIIRARITFLPVETSFRDDERVVTSSLVAVDLGWALVTVLLGGAAT